MTLVHVFYPSAAQDPWMATFIGCGAGESIGAISNTPKVIFAPEGDGGAYLSMQESDEYAALRLQHGEAIAASLLARHSSYVTHVIDR